MEVILKKMKKESKRSKLDTDPWKKGIKTIIDIYSLTKRNKIKGRMYSKKKKKRSNSKVSIDSWKMRRKTIIDTYYLRKKK